MKSPCDASCGHSRVCFSAAHAYQPRYDFPQLQSHTPAGAGFFPGSRTIVTFALDEPAALIAVVGVVFLGRLVNDWLPVPGRRNTPTSVTGGIVAWTVLSPLVGSGWVAGEFLERPAHLAAGDVFATVGMGACNRALAAGGRQFWWRGIFIHLPRR